MLTGVFVFLFGTGLWLDSISLVLVFTPLYVLMNYWELKHIEEPELVKRLGDRYIDYRRRTPMFIPKRAPEREPETPNRSAQPDRGPRGSGPRPLDS